MEQLWFVAAEVQASNAEGTGPEGNRFEAIAIGTTPGLYDIQTFIQLDGKPFTGKVWKYTLHPTYLSVIYNQNSRR